MLLPAAPNVPPGEEEQRAHLGHQTESATGQGYDDEEQEEQVGSFRVRVRVWVELRPCAGAEVPHGAGQPETQDQEDDAEDVQGPQDGTGLQDGAGDGSGGDGDGKRRLITNWDTAMQFFSLFLKIFFLF